MTGGVGRSFVTPLPVQLGNAGSHTPSEIVVTFAGFAGVLPAGPYTVHVTGRISGSDAPLASVNVIATSSIAGSVGGWIDTAAATNVEMVTESAPMISSFS